MIVTKGKQISKLHLVPEKQSIPKTVSAIYILILAISLFSLGFTSYAFASPSPTSSLYMEMGIYPGAPDYTIWREDSTFYAKDINGQIPSTWGESSNASYVALNAINNGDYIHFGSGTFTIDRNVIKLDNNTRITGIGVNTILQLKTYADAGSAETILLQNSDYATGNVNIHIENLCLDGNDQPGAIASGYPIGIFLRNVYNFTINNLKIYGEFSNGIRMGESQPLYGDVGCHYGLVANNYMTGIGETGYGGAIYILDCSTHINVENNQVINSDRGIMIEGNDGYEVTNIILSNNQALNIATHSCMSLNWAFNIEYSNNHCENSGVANGLGVSNSRNVTIMGGLYRSNDDHGIKVITNNRDISIYGAQCLDNTGIGLLVQDTHKVTITGGSFSGNGQIGIRIYNGTTGCYDITITGVEANQNTQSGIWIRDSQSVTITGGWMSYNGYDGIRIWDSAGTTVDVLVVGVICNDNTNRGIRFVDGDYLTITSSHCFDNGDEGILVWEAGTNVHVNLCYNSTSWIS